jgi:dTDP-4-dehydrorhamnose 3,5-epimerase
MKVGRTSLPGVLLIEPVIYRDDRGFFIERFSEQRYREAGIETSFVQDNHSYSRRGVLRGLHFQRRHPQGKLVSVIRGRVYDVAVDVRHGSPTFAQWEGIILDDRECHQLYIPPGFAHGFCVLSEWADFVYKCTACYDPLDEGGVRWSDPTIGIEWPISDPVLSERDLTYPTLAQLGAVDLPAYGF